MRLLLLLLLLGCWLLPNIWSQNKQELEKKRQSINRTISKTNKQLWATKQRKKLALEKLENLKDSIAAKTTFIDSILIHSSRLSHLQKRQQIVSDALKSDLDLLYDYHKKIVAHYYKQCFKSNPPLSGKRLQAQQYSRRALQQRCTQIALVASLQQDLDARAHFITRQKALKDSLLLEAQYLQEQLHKEQKQKTKKMTKLQNTEQQLRQHLAIQKKAKKRLSKKIEQAILQQIAASKSAARHYQKRPLNNHNNPPTPPLVASKETQAFARQKGRLMWPIYQGKIIGYYGQQAHPLFKDVLLNNNGIDVQGQYNSVVRNVYEGIVVSVFTIPSYHNAVMVKHGEYYTTYSNIAKVYVKKGQRLKTGGQIGTIGRSPDGKGHLLHFELWYNKTKENPMYWIKASSKNGL